MMSKLVLPVFVLLCIAATTNAKQCIARFQMGSGELKSTNVFGKREDHDYYVPPNVLYVSLDYKDHSSSSINFGSGNGKVTLHWKAGQSIARVHAWVNGKLGGTNHVAWTVWGTLLYSC